MPLRILKIDEVKLTKREEQLFENMLSNAQKVNDAISEVNMKEMEKELGMEPIEFLRKALAYELRTKRRPATVGRLVGRLKTLVNRSMDSEVIGGGA